VLYLKNAPLLLRWLQPQGLIWHGRQSRDTRAVYLTFDDGPHPDVTPQVLDMLRQYDARATFFCVGQNAERYPELFSRLKKEGHEVGNHTHRHKDGWKTDIWQYLGDVEEAGKLIKSSLFRPPYGHVTRAQAKQLQHLGYTIIMWDVLTGDFDAIRSAEACFRTIEKFAKPGSIIVFHDSLKAKDRMLPALKMALEYFRHKGWQPKALDNSNIR
jgi:peptidoglycan/xylan/chitin deacetylase (PgdA/CDA1 family)